MGLRKAWGVAAFTVLALAVGACRSAPAGRSAVAVVVPAAAHSPSPSPRTTTAPVRTKHVPSSARPARAAPLRGYPAYAATAVVSIVDVHSAPDAAAPTISRLARTNAYGAPRTFLVLGTSAGWYHVRLPTQPNGTTGWIRASAVKVSGLRYAVTAHIRSFRLDVSKDGRVVTSYRIGIGSDRTPTPLGAYYVTELIRPPTRGTPYGDFVLGLSGYSAVSGVQIALHGTNDPSTIGRRASNGCIHLLNADIDALATILPLGTPVTIESN